MSDTTKEKALKKLDTMQINVGYPEDVQSYMDDVEIKSAADGGSYFEKDARNLQRTGEKFD